MRRRDRQGLFKPSNALFQGALAGCSGLPLIESQPVTEPKFTLSLVEAAAPTNQLSPHLPWLR